MNKKALSILGCVLVLACAVPASAQRFEFGIGWSFYNPGLDASYVHRYSPLYLQGGTYASLAEQTLSVKPKDVNGLSVLVNFFPVSHIGIQFLADYFKAPLEGANAPYTYSITYQRPMPDHTTRTVSYASEIAWPATTGDVSEIVLSLNGIVRLPLSRSIFLCLSGGPSYFYSEAKAGFIGYTKFRTGDDGRLYIQTFQLAYEFGPQSRVGFNLGAEAAFRISPLISLVGEFRYFKSGGAETPLRLTPTDILADPIENVTSTMNLGSLKVDPSFARFSAGIKFSF
jgi:opacity protein-like surface antigen